MKPHVLPGIALVAAVYIGAYFFIFDPSTSVYEAGKWVDCSASRFGEDERIGDISMYVPKKHWTNSVWRPVDVVVRRLRQTK